MASRTWTSVSPNGSTQPIDINPSHISLTTPPRTDIWRPSGEQDDFNAPYIYTSVSSGKFHRLAVSVAADWKTKYDQGGLVMLWPDAAAKNQRRWVKFGIEYFQGKPCLGVVGCDRFADWSLCPLPTVGEGKEARIEAERVDQTLWVYVVVDGEKQPLREIKWAFLEDRDQLAELWVGVYAAKPTPEEDGSDTGITVTFRDLELETQ